MIFSDACIHQAKVEQDKIGSIVSECGMKLVKAREEGLARLGAYEKQSGAVAGRSSVSPTCSDHFHTHWLLCNAGRSKLPRSIC
jgi:hypothetical protein